MLKNRDVSRLKNFSDAVFALSATLLVVSLEVPNSYDALMETVAGFPAFALGFAAIVSLWHNHREFFAHYPLDDNRTLVLNSLLLFIILVYVYPLKLLTQIIAERFLGAAPAILSAISLSEIQGLYLVFGGAALGVFVVFALLHMRAWQARDALELDASGRLRLRGEIYSYVLLVAISLLSLAASALGLGLDWGLPIWLFLLSPLFELVMWRRRIHSRATAD
jgi:uncharacterized membrane protein